MKLSADKTPPAKKRRAKDMLKKRWTGTDFSGSVLRYLCY
jgi:hypothetical protein